MVREADGCSALVTMWVIELSWSSLSCSDDLLLIAPRFREGLESGQVVRLEGGIRWSICGWHRAEDEALWGYAGRERRAHRNALRGVLWRGLLWLSTCHGLSASCRGKKKARENVNSTKWEPGKGSKHAHREQGDIAMEWLQEKTLIDILFANRFAVDNMLDGGP